MSFHVPLLGELFVAAGALKRFLPVVAEHVPLHAAQGEEALGAQRALVRPLACVGAHVHYQMPLGGEAFATVGAGVRHLARVGPSVKQQLPRGQKGLAAHGAEVVPLPSVHLRVPEEAALAEGLPADGAYVAGPLVQLLVLSEGRAAQEALVALAADEPAALLVEPLVLVKAREADEAFLTLDAAVGEAVQPHVSGELVRKLKNLLTRGAFGVFLREAFVHRSRSQKPPVKPRRRSLLPSSFVFSVVLLDTAILFSFSPAFGSLLLLLLLRLATFAKRLCFYASDRRVFLRMLRRCRLFVAASVARRLSVDIYLCIRHTRERQSGAACSAIAAGGS